MLQPSTKTPPQRPAAAAVPGADSQDAVAQSRYFSPPFALAVPEDAVVRVVGPQASCTGTLIENPDSVSSESMILTAHHCIVERTPHGEFTSKVVDAKKIRIELGGDFLAWGEVGVRAIVTPPCGESGGGGDVAVLVLTRKIVGLASMTARLDTPPRMGEKVDTVGFGRCASSDGIRRHAREGGEIRATTSEAFVVNAAVCPGDSGGPLILRGTKEVVGVVSLSAMDGDERTKAPSVMARIDVFRSMFSNARLIADGASPAEVPPLECK